VGIYLAFFNRFGTIAFLIPTIKMHAGKPVILVVHGGSAAMNPGADYVQPLVQSPLAPEQGAGPVTANFSIKLRLLEKPTVPVSTGLDEALRAE